MLSQPSKFVSGWNKTNQIMKKSLIWCPWQIILIWKRAGENDVDWTGKTEIKTGKSPGGRRKFWQKVKGYILTDSRFKRENLWQFLSLISEDFNLYVCGTPLCDNQT